MTGTRREVTWLSQAATQAKDAALTRVVGMLDQMKDRGEADQVLNLVRQRLRALRPPRPLGFARVLFLPLDGAIVATPRWRRGEATIPRSALLPLAGAVERALGANAPPLMAQCEGRTTADGPVVVRIGAVLWPVAARSLPAAPPPDWDQSGLPAADYAAISELCRAVWAQGPVIWAAMAAGEHGPPDDMAQSALGAMLPAGARPLAAAMASILTRASQPGRIAALAARLDPQLRAQAQVALDTVLDTPPPALDLLDLAGAARVTEALLTRLDDLEQCGLLVGERQQRLAALRRQVDEACRERFLAGAETQLVAPAAKLIAAATVESAEVTAMEAGARQLRALQAVGRRVGGGAAYDKALTSLYEALVGLLPQARPGGLTRMDLARSVEILCGPDAAQKLLAT